MTKDTPSLNALSKDRLMREALMAAREEIQILRQRLTIAEARMDVLDTLAHITGRRSVSCGSGWPNVLKLIEEALAPEPNPVPPGASAGGITRV